LFQTEIKIFLINFFDSFINSQLLVYIYSF
jgi:hypothetical protein